MSSDTADMLRQAIGAGAVRQGASGVAQVVPASSDGVAEVLKLATRHRWTTAVAGSGSWQSLDGPEAVVVSLMGINQIFDVRPADLVLTAQAGVSIGHLHRTARNHGTWVALDPPGTPERTVGSVLATGTAGPLRHRFGGVRDQVLGLTVVTGDGRVIRSGGTTAKNVAGFDLAKLHIGGFGAFGVIAECHLRLRAQPQADTTWIAQGSRDRLTAVARRLADLPIDAAAIELFSPSLATGSEWVLAVRLIGGPDAVAAEGDRLGPTPGVTWLELDSERRALLWNAAARAIVTPPVTVRLGVLATAVDETLDLVTARLGDGHLSVGAASGNVRWSGETGAVEIRALRTLLAEREVPLTVERAPWRIRAGAGHFGAYHEGVGGLVSKLRQTFDPNRIFVAPLAERDDP